MLRTLIGAIGVAIAVAVPAAAQDAPAAAPRVTLTDLRTPTAPAFSLLGIAPIDIERPSTPRALAVSLLSAVNDGDGSLLPRNFALEVAPYWLTQRPGLTFEAYSNPTVQQSLRQTFSISVAAARASDEEVARIGDATNIGVGFRASPLPGRAPAEVATLLATLRMAQTRALVLDTLMEAADTPTAPLPQAIKDTLDELAKASVDVDRAAYLKMLEGIEASLVATLAADTPEAKVRTALRALSADGDAAMSKVALQVQEANRTRVGLVLDVAGGFAIRSAVGDLATTEVVRGGAWVSLGYAGKATKALALARVLRNRSGLQQAESIVDLGGRVLHQVGDLTVSGELVARFDRSAITIDDVTQRAVVTLEYKVNDDFGITSTFGRDYGNTTLGLDGTTVAILGVNVGLGKIPALVAGRQK